MPKTIVFTTVLSLALFATFVFGFDGRIALSSDGNDHDSDDWGATAMSLAILARKGLQADVVHYDYASHIWGNSSNSAFPINIRESALGGADRFGFDKSRFFEGTTDLNGAVDNIKKEINASSAGDPLFFIIAGPMEVPWMGINAADANKRQYVTCISHSNWNNDHGKNDHGGHDDDDIRALGANFVQIKDQNGGFGKQSMSNWAWLKNMGPNYSWTYDRIDLVYTEGDASDAGMAYWLLTGGSNGGDQNGTTSKLREFLKDPVPIQAFKTLKVNKLSVTLSNGIGKVSLQDYAKDGSVKIFNVKSQLLYEGILVNGRAEFDMRGNGSGVYILRVITNAHNYERKYVLGL